MQHSDQTLTFEKSARAIRDEVVFRRHRLTHHANLLEGCLRDRIEQKTEQVEEAFHTLKNAFSVEYHVEHHPWRIVAGAIGTGWLVGRTVRRRSAVDSLGSGEPLREMPFRLNSAMTGIRGLAIGAVAGVIRDIVSKIIPLSVTSEVREKINRIASEMSAELVESATRDIPRDDAKSIPKKTLSNGIDEIAAWT